MAARSGQSQESRPTTAETLHEVVADRPAERLDVFLARTCEISRARAANLVEAGQVRRLTAVPAEVGRPETLERQVSRRSLVLKPGLKLEGGEAFVVTIPAPQPATPQAESMPLVIVYEDRHLLVVDKPAGMPVHPGAGHSEHTLVNAVLAHCPDLPGIGGVQRPGIVHRLDKDTSGLIIIAKDDRTHIGLSAALKDREVHKTYLALVEGRLDPKEAMIDAPIGRDPNNRRRMMVIPSGRASQTSYRVRGEYQLTAEGLAPLASSPPPAATVYSLIEASPITGRTHQIRVHLASLGRAVASDPVYGHIVPTIPRLFLHAWKLEFRHPITGEEMSFEAPLASELAAALPGDA